MKFRLKVVLDVSAPGAKLPKDELGLLIQQAVEQTLEDSLFDGLYDLIAGETEAENWDSLEVIVDEVS